MVKVPQKPKQESLLLECHNDDDHFLYAGRFLVETYGPTWQSHNNPNLDWINQENDSLKIDQIRAMSKQLAFGTGQHRVTIILYADKATLAAQNALLKILEEPPRLTTILLTFSQINKLLPTVISRCRLIRKSSTGIDRSQIIENLQQDNTNASGHLTELTILSFIEKLFDKQPPSYGETIAFVEEQLKEKELSSDALQELQKALEKQKILPGNANRLHQYAKIQQKALNCLTMLGQNVNAKLALEHFLFSCKKIAQESP
ncbi:MAG: hypothetical protein ACOZAN_03685 [Patescibacteria group bacterium]